ncbi:hypothetical protein T484DRAFT_1759159 [Baffinella frigidus]|nr:hypothetical protein T484DRAFT_1759159 [Cryptophyta sp. CCMP2293]
MRKPQPPKSPNPNPQTNAGRRCGRTFGPSSPSRRSRSHASRTPRHSPSRRPSACGARARPRASRRAPPGPGAFRLRTIEALRGPGITFKGDEKLRIGIVGSGLSGMVTAMDLADAGHHVEIFEARNFIGGKVGSWIDKDGNHIEMGLHVFFGCYYNLFGILQRIGTFEKSMRLKEHNHIFVNKGGSTGGLDFRMGGIGAPFNGLKAFAMTEQLGPYDKLMNAIRLGTSPIVRALVDFDGGMDMVRDLDDISFSEWFLSFGGSRGSMDRLWDPIAYALGFIDCDNISARCMLTIFQLFAVRSEASVLRMCEGSPDRFVSGPIRAYLEERGVKFNLNSRVEDIIHDVQPPAPSPDVPGIKKLLPENFRKIEQFDKIWNLSAVPVATVQLRFDGWVTELADMEAMKHVKSDLSNGKAAGIDNLLYSADAEFSCFADLALVSPADYYKEGEGSLLQCVFALFPSAKEQGLKVTWSNVVKLSQSLYREAPGMDKFRPDQSTPIPNFFLSGAYTYQDYLDSMEGATKSGLNTAKAVNAATPGIATMLRTKKAAAA